MGHFFSNKGITWPHISGRAHHFRGIWEATVKVMKTLLAKTVATQHLSWEELTTVLGEVEAVMNSTPLITTGVCSIRWNSSPDTQSFPDWKTSGSSTSKNWCWWCKNLTSATLEPLPTPICWAVETVEQGVHFRVVILLKDQETFQRSWPLARILEVHPGRDRHVRVATLRTEWETCRRPTVKLVPLISEEGHCLLGWEDVRAHYTLTREKSSRPQTVNLSPM